jgi:hypothetical protein
MKTFTAAHFLSRELSWLEFNQRVLDEALDPSNPLLERVKFFTITSSNLDEFFEVRVAGLKQQIESDVVQRSADGKTSSEILRAIHKRVREMLERQYRCWREELLPALAKNGIHLFDYANLSQEDKDVGGEVLPLQCPARAHSAGHRSLPSLSAAPQQIAQYRRPGRNRAGRRSRAPPRRGAGAAGAAPARALAARRTTRARLSSWDTSSAITWGIFFPARKSSASGISA